MNLSQNWFALTTLGLTSPLTNLILFLKITLVIVMSIVCFGKKYIGPNQMVYCQYLYRKAKPEIDRQD